MIDIGIFALGCFVSLFVLAAVGLLLWGAANERSSVLGPQDPSARTPKIAPQNPDVGGPTASERIAS